MSGRDPRGGPGGMSSGLEAVCLDMAGTTVADDGLVESAVAVGVLMGGDRAERLRDSGATHVIDPVADLRALIGCGAATVGSDQHSTFRR